MNQREYLSRLDAHLDDHRDPLDDEQLVTHLEAHPELLPAFAALRADLRQLRARPRRTRRRRQVVVLAAALLLVSAGSALVCLVGGGLPGDAAPETAATPHERPPASRILAASLVELPPLLRAAGSFTLRQSLVQSTASSFETYETMSQAR